MRTEREMSPFTQNGHGHWNLQLSCLVRQLAPVHLCESQEWRLLLPFFREEKILEHGLQGRKK